MNLDTNVYLAMPVFDDGQPVSFCTFYIHDREIMSGCIIIVCSMNVRSLGT